MSNSIESPKPSWRAEWNSLDQKFGFGAKARVRKEGETAGHPLDGRYALELIFFRGQRGHCLELNNWRAFA
jgi:hypothetical protein